MTRRNTPSRLLGCCVALPLLGLCKVALAQCSGSQASIDVTQSNVFTTAFPITVRSPTLVTAFNDGSNASNGSVIHATSTAARAAMPFTNQDRTVAHVRYAVGF